MMYVVLCFRWCTSPIAQVHHQGEDVDTGENIGEVLGQTVVLSGDGGCVEERGNYEDKLHE